MNTETLKRLGVALAALLAVWAGAALLRRSSRDEASTPSFAAVDTLAVDRVTVRRGADTLRFEKSGTGWTVNGLRADATLVAAMLRGFGEARRAEVVGEAAASHARLGVDSAGRRVAVEQGGKVVLELVVGTRGSSWGTVHLREPSSATTWLATTGLADIVDRQVDEWRDKVIAKVEPDSVGSVELSRGVATYRLVRADSGWTLDGARADSAAVTALLDRYRTLVAAGFASPAQADSAQFGRPDHRLRLLSRGGRVLVSLEADSTASAVWVRREGDATVFRVDPWQLPTLVPEKKSFAGK